MKRVHEFDDCPALTVCSIKFLTCAVLASLNDFPLIDLLIFVKSTYT